jgi:hypothetical protein
MTETTTTEHPADPGPAAAGPTAAPPASELRLEPKPDRPERCPSSCRLRARCRRTGPPGADCPLLRRRAEPAPAAPHPPAIEPRSDGPDGARPRSRPESRSGEGPRPRPPRRRSREDEWSSGRMRGVTKPSWGGRFASKMRGESGMSTAEYAVGTLAAVAFAGVLLKVLTSGAVQDALTGLIERALS